MSDTQVNRNIFLATTALEEFWDTTKPIVFLGEWCLLYDRRSFWEPLNGRLLESPFDTGEAAHVAYHYVHGIYEQILPLLGNILNTLHEKRHSQRYWRIVLGPWLQLYLSVSYDRYSHLKRALEQYPDCTTIVLPEESFVVPSDTLDFAWLVKEDLFNLQIYTKILTTIGRTYPCGTRIVHASTSRKFDDHSWKQKVLSVIARINVGVGPRATQRIFLRSSYFSHFSVFQFFIRTVGKTLPMWRPSVKRPSPLYNNDLRKNLPKIEIGKGEFERCLSAILFSDMPQCFIEGFCAVSREAHNTYPKTPKAILSANAWYFEESFKQWAALSAEKGTLLVGTPHGGNYGGLVNMPAENHETAIVDRFYSWGWDRADCAAEVIPFPASMLVGRKKVGASNLKRGILWATTSAPRYLIQFPFLPKFFQEYLCWQDRFAKTLCPKIVLALRLRPHHEDGGWKIVQRISESIPDVTIETWDIPFQESLADCRLYICDHLSTTFAEALAANKPTLLFWNPEANKLRPAAQPYYDLLRKSGILFDTPENAGVAVNRVYDHVESWWNDPQRQNTVEIFCQRFARNSPDAIALWVTEFNRIAALPGSS